MAQFVKSNRNRIKANKKLQKQEEEKRILLEKIKLLKEKEKQDKLEKNKEDKIYARKQAINVIMSMQSTKVIFKLFDLYAKYEMLDNEESISNLNAILEFAEEDSKDTVAYLEKEIENIILTRKNKVKGVEETQEETQQTNEEIANMMYETKDEEELEQMEQE